MGYSAQRGSVFIYILLAIALLAALSYAMMKGSRTGTSGLTEDRRRLYAGEILNYADSISKSVQTLRLRGCTESQISFENPIESGYANAGAPSDNSCHVFNISGGKTIWQGAPDGSNDGNFWRFQGNVGLTDMGGTDKELLAVLPGVVPELCALLNDRLGISNPSGAAPTNDAFDVSVKFTGTYDDSGGNVFGDNGDESNFAGRAAGCFNGPPAGTHYFYQVLIGR